MCSLTGTTPQDRWPLRLWKHRLESLSRRSGNLSCHVIANGDPDQGVQQQQQQQQHSGLSAYLRVCEQCGLPGMEQRKTAVAQVAASAWARWPAIW